MQRVESKLNASKEVESEGSSWSGMEKVLETLAGTWMGEEEEERSWEEEGLLLRECNTQISGFGGGALQVMTNSKV